MIRAYAGELQAPQDTSYSGPLHLVWGNTFARFHAGDHGFVGKYEEHLATVGHATHHDGASPTLVMPD